ncbi:MAG: alpha-ketoglutarate-dependent dioxygenase AlkB [Vulcanimicrobiaceae bacterium]
MGTMAQQLCFFIEELRTIATTPRGAIVYQPGIFSPAQSAEMFEHLLQTIPWSAETMKMYDKLVTVPRLVAWYRDPQPLPEVLQTVRERVGEHLRVRFTAVSLNYYRDGGDSVAWHSDKDEELTADPVVALVSLGATRQMQFRTKALPRTQLRCDLEPGSVLVMRGDVQVHWEHHIPKVARPTSARISIALRTKVPT